MFSSRFVVIIYCVSVAPCWWAAVIENRWLDRLRSCSAFVLVLLRDGSVGADLCGFIPTDWEVWDHPSDANGYE